MPDMPLRITSDGRNTSVTHAVTGETIPCTRVEFRHDVRGYATLSLDIIATDIDVDVTARGEVHPPAATAPSPEAIEDARAAAYDRTWGRRP